MGAHAGVSAQPDVINRIDDIFVLSEKDNAAAILKLQVLDGELGAATPYAVRREYLKTRIALEVDAGQIDPATASIDTLLKLAQAQHDELGMVLAGTFDASLMIAGGKPGAAMIKLTEILPTALRTADPDALWRLYLFLGNAQLAVGKFEPALDSFLKCLQYADQQQKHPKQLRLRALNSLNNLYGAMKNWDKARQVIEEALILANELGSTKMKATLYINQGVMYSSLGRDAESVAATERALLIGRQSGLIGVQATALSNLADGYLISRNYPKAETLARQALVKFQETREQSGIVAAHANIGFSLMGQGKTKEGVAEVRTALKLSHDSALISVEEGILAELGRMYEQAGLYREALATVRDQQKLSEQLFRTDRELSVATLQAQFDSVQRQKQIELLARENALKDSEIRRQQMQKIVTLLGAIVTILIGVFVYWLYRRVKKINQKLHKANHQLEFHSVRDPLTGLFNRRSFLELMNNRPADSAGERRDDTIDRCDGLMVLDVDHFKHINDTMGHAAGDNVLMEIAKRLRNTVRDSDMVMRWGGEEFLVYSPKANISHLRGLAERLLNAIGKEPMLVDEQLISVTVTAGFLSLPFSGLSETECNWEKAMQLADRVLYLGKINGRNRAYGLTQLLVPFAQAMPVLEQDIAKALKMGMVGLVEVLGPTRAGRDDPMM
jgi:diguanylate cyclase (GGDEF)-like protein